MRENSHSGFTLIELSIVLVIIGLIVGGVLVGQDLIHAAAIRAQIAQIDKYDAAVNTFRTKYNAIPGDMTPDNASAFGFFTRTGAVGDGDGDGYVFGLSLGGDGSYILGGENVLFWTDLSAAGLIQGTFNDSRDIEVSANTDVQYAAELPRAAIGNNNFIWVNGSYRAKISSGLVTYTKDNGFQIISINGIFSTAVSIKPGMTPLEGLDIDQKIDDGLPLSGNVIAMYPDSAIPYYAPGVEVDLGYLASLCVLPGSPVTYNVGAVGVSTAYNCSLRFNGSW